jgi:hypothetical protein
VFDPGHADVGITRPGAASSLRPPVLTLALESFAGSSWKSDGSAGWSDPGIAQLFVHLGQGGFDAIGLAQPLGDHGALAGDVPVIGAEITRPCDARSLSRKRC